MAPEASVRSWGPLLLATAGPVVWIGGALSEVVAAFCLVVLIALHARCMQFRTAVVVPWVAGAGAWVAILVFVQWLPLGALREALVPEIGAHVDRVLSGTGVEAWPGMTIVPGDTALEAARVAGLTVLLVVAAQLPWRLTTAIVAGTGAGLALIGFLHEAASAEAIYGLYVPHELGAMAGPALRTSFVNANHQASLLLMGLFAAAALALDQFARASGTDDAAAADRHRDGALAALAAVTLQLPALVLSLSRGALVALIAMTPWALWIGVRATRAGRRRGGPTLWMMRAAFVAGLVGIAVVVAQQGAWTELKTVADLDQPRSSAATKFRLAEDALGLVQWSRPLGVGRGAALDLFGAVDTQPSHILYTHVESMPAALVVELGWLGGGAVVLALAAWWLHAYRSARGDDAAAQRIVLVGLAALALHNSLEFSLELLGVAAPAVVLMGGIAGSQTGTRVVVARGVARVGATMWLVGALALACWAAPRSADKRQAADARVFDGAASGVAALRMRPLDGRLQGLIARQAARDGQWQRAVRWARLSTSARPGSPDAWFVRAAAERALGRAVASDASMRAGLSRLHEPPSKDLVDFILQMAPSARRVAEVTPAEGAAWKWLAAGLRERAPGHADAVAAKRMAFAPDDARALGLRVALATAAGSPSLALHHARMWTALEARYARPYVAVARALRTFEPARLDEARTGLENALAQVDFVSKLERGSVEEELILILVALADHEALRRARSLGAQLLARPAPRAVHSRRERLVAGLDEFFLPTQRVTTKEVDG